MVIRATEAVAHPGPGPDHPTPTAAIDALADELRTLYAETFRLVLRAAGEARQRFETPDGTGPVDPIFAADTAACRAINRHLPTVIARWLPGAQLVEGIDEPAVIDSRWLYQQRIVDIQWSYSSDFGAAEGLTVVER